jgi:SAM-dependent methyltransferase
VKENPKEVAARPDANAAEIAQYYDANTHKFLRFGGAGETGAIHRAIWAPGVSSREDAFLFLNRLIANAIKPLLGRNPQESHLVDLGCGVGGTSTFLARELGIRVTGISISDTQIAIANARIQDSPLQQHVHFVSADFDELPELGQVDALCAIESFVHARDASNFFSQAAATLRANGRLIVCDDFLGESVPKEGWRHVARFRRGWQLNSLITVSEIERLALQHGFRLVESHSLSEYLRGFPTVVRWAISTICAIPLSWAYWQNLSGGTALQLCVKRGWTQYRALVWEKI